MERQDEGLENVERDSLEDDHVSAVEGLPESLPEPGSGQPSADEPSPGTDDLQC